MTIVDLDVRELSPRLMEGSEMNVSTDEERCVGSGQCVLAAPEVFDQRDSDGLVALLQDTPPESQLPNVRQAADLCPAGAIHIQEQST